MFKLGRISSGRARSPWRRLPQFRQLGTAPYRAPLLPKQPRRPPAPLGRFLPRGRQFLRSHAHSGERLTRSFFSWARASMCACVSSAACFDWVFACSIIADKRSLSSGVCLANAAKSRLFANDAVASASCNCVAADFSITPLSAASALLKRLIISALTSPSDCAGATLIPGTSGTMTSVPAGTFLRSAICGFASRKAACAFLDAAAAFGPLISNTSRVKSARLVSALIVTNFIVPSSLLFQNRSRRHDVKRRPWRGKRSAVNHNVSAADVAQRGERPILWQQLQNHRRHPGHDRGRAFQIIAAGDNRAGLRLRDGLRRGACDCRVEKTTIRAQRQRTARFHSDHRRPAITFEQVAMEADDFLASRQRRQLVAGKNINHFSYREECKVRAHFDQATSGQRADAHCEPARHAGFVWQRLVTTHDVVAEVQSRKRAETINANSVD